MIYRASETRSATIGQPRRFQRRVDDGCETISWWAPKTRAAAIVEMLLGVCGIALGLAISFALFHLFLAIFKEISWAIFIVPEIPIAILFGILAGFVLAGYFVYRILREAGYWPQKIIMTFPSQFCSVQWLRHIDPSIKEYEIQWLRGRWEMSRDI